MLSSRTRPTGKSCITMRQCTTDERDGRVARRLIASKSSALTGATRKRPRTTRRSVTHHFEINGKDGVVDGYITVGLYEDGAPCEVFLVLAKTGEAIRGLARAWATCFSICLQYGAPLDTLTQKFKYCRFEPAGMTDNEEIRIAHSIVDYVCRWLEITFLEKEKRERSAQPAKPNGLSA